MSLWGGVLLSAGLALSACAKQLEQRQKRLEEAAKNARVTPLARDQKYLKTDDYHGAQENLPQDEIRRAIPTVDEYRDKFKHGPVGKWHTAEIIPLGSAWEFRSDGTGTFIQYNGLGADEIPFAWRAAGDWKIEVKLDFSQLDAEREEVAFDSSTSIVEDDWDTIEYDFNVANVGYYETVVMFEVGASREYGFMVSWDYLIYNQPQPEQQANA